MKILEKIAKRYDIAYREQNTMNEPQRAQRERALRDSTLIIKNGLVQLTVKSGNIFAKHA